MLKGNLDHVSHDRLWGWAFDPETPEARVELVLIANGEPIARFRADLFRQFLLDDGMGDGAHGFALTLSKPLPRHRRHVIEVRRLPDGASAPGSPVTLEASSAFDEEARAVFSRLIAAAETEADFRERLAFLDTEATKLKGAWAQRGFAAKVARAGEGPARALVVDGPPPSLRDAPILSHIAALGRIGFQVDYASVDPDGDARLIAECGATPRGAPEVASVEELVRRERDGYAVVWLHGLAGAGYLDIVRRAQRRARIVWATDGLAHVALMRQAKVEQRPELSDYAQLVQRQEELAAIGANATLVSSRADLDLLRGRAPAERIVLGPASVKPASVVAPFGHRQGIVFVLRPGEPADVDAAHTLVDTLMPAIWRFDPQIVLTLVGGDLPAELAGPKIVMRRRPADLHEIFEEARLSVAPLDFGAGMKPEIIASFAAGLPCVMMAVVAEALSLPPSLARYIAADYLDFARKVVNAHRDGEGAAAARVAALAYVADRFSEAQTDAAVAKAAGVSRPVGKRATPTR